MEARGTIGMQVAVHTIALNEAANAKRWVNSAVDADFHALVDTGSTDGTVERKLGRQEFGT
jgi:hypothetical protein